MLLALEKKLLAEVGKTDINPALPVGTLTEIQLYQQPRYGEVDGMPVRLEGEGNRIGFSPVSKCVELGTHTAERETAWIPTGRVKNITLDPFAPGTTRARKPTTNKTT